MIKIFITFFLLINNTTSKKKNPYIKYDCFAKLEEEKKSKKRHQRKKKKFTININIKKPFKNLKKQYKNFMKSPINRIFLKEGLKLLSIILLIIVGLTFILLSHNNLKKIQNITLEKYDNTLSNINVIINYSDFLTHDKNCDLKLTQYLLKTVNSLEFLQKSKILSITFDKESSKEYLKANYNSIIGDNWFYFQEKSLKKIQEYLINESYNKKDPIIKNLNGIENAILSYLYIIMSIQAIFTIDFYNANLNNLNYFNKYLKREYVSSTSKIFSTFKQPLFLKPFYQYQYKPELWNFISTTYHQDNIITINNLEDMKQIFKLIIINNSKIINNMLINITDNNIKNIILKFIEKNAIFLYVKHNKQF